MAFILSVGISDFVGAILCAHGCYLAFKIGVWCNHRLIYSFNEYENKCVNTENTLIFYCSTCQCEESRAKTMKMLEFLRVHRFMLIFFSVNDRCLFSKQKLRAQEKVEEKKTVVGTYYKSVRRCVSAYSWYMRACIILYILKNKKRDSAFDEKKENEWRHWTFIPDRLVFLLWKSYDECSTR